MARITQIKLSHFRCYEGINLDHISKDIVVLYGDNGAGKTNILEALSLFVPGRGLRSAKSSEVQKNSSLSPWAISLMLQSKYGDEVRLGTGVEGFNDGAARDKRIVRINGKTAKSQSELARHLSCVWITPQMDRLFLDSSRERRKFLDRLVFAFDPGHAGRITRYENALSQRSRLLRDGAGDDLWLKGLEHQIAETGVAIAAARNEFIERLKAACMAAPEGEFPRARINVSGYLEEHLNGRSALDLEEGFAIKLAQSRDRDAITGGASVGPHKSDLEVVYAVKNMPASQCSTGEQKALLIGLVLAHARLIRAERGAPPLLLLDEVAAHLDYNRRESLYQILEELGGQVWMTGTDLGDFESLGDKAHFFEVKDHRIHRKPEFEVVGAEVG
ncbi:MAG: DNA replication/repair protein RecF [Alphaproteobacteria bacterium]|nr:DNA replication/repair protein RecF [Alphaproteobacteria bacterium]